MPGRAAARHGIGGLLVAERPGGRAEPPQSGQSAGVVARFTIGSPSVHHVPRVICHVFPPLGADSGRFSARFGALPGR